MVLVLDIQDHAKTFTTFSTLVAQGLITKPPPHTDCRVEWHGRCGEQSLIREKRGGG